MSDIVRPVLNPYKVTGSFKFWCQKVLPTVYDDSLSYYETLCKVVNYLNDVIENVDGLHEDISNLFEFVFHYFDSLEVQEAINKKLDEMAEDGTFDAIIERLMDEYKEEIDGLIRTQNRKITVLEGRMDEFSSLTEGSTTGDAELADIRVGENGVTYATAGDAVRGQFENLDETISYDRNITWVKEKTVREDYNGLLLDWSYTAVSNVIPCKGGTVLSKIPANDGTYEFVQMLCTYKSGVFYNRIVMHTNATTDIPNGVTEIRFLFGRAQSSGVTITDADISTYFNVMIFEKSVSNSDLEKNNRDELPKVAYTKILDWAKDKATEVHPTGFRMGRYDDTNGQIINGGTHYIRSTYRYYFECIDRVRVTAPNGFTFSVNEYDAHGTWVRNICPNTTPVFEFTPVNGRSYGFTFCYWASLTAEEITSQIVNSFVCEMIAYKVSNSRPEYVAIGASTTVGAIHHVDGESITYLNDYPTLVGKALGLDWYNLGEGSTGLIARNEGRQPNFMDVIYNNRNNAFDTAKLITLQFGYGNDRVRGLPIGDWNDYFNYDEVADFYVEDETESNEAGVTEMLELGATLFGCLNWCIKWIGDHYPNAVLVLISGAPSSNKYRTIEVVESIEGVSPYKIDVTLPNLDVSNQLEILREYLNIPIINLEIDTLPFSYYSSVAKDEDGLYSIFSSTGTSDEPVWNSHPNAKGYEMYARYLAGRIGAFFTK